MNKEKVKLQKRDRRRDKIRSRVNGTAVCPRLSVFRSNKGVFLQIINDEEGKTIVSVDSNEVKATGDASQSFEAGKLLAKKAVEKKIDEVVFDRGGYKFHGRVKDVADGARDGGLKF